MADFLPYPLINGYEPSFASIELKIAGSGVILPAPGIKAINYNDKTARAKIFGNSVLPQGRTRGQVTPSGSVEFYRRQWDSALQILTGSGAWGISERSWVVTVTYAEVGFSPIMDVLEGVSFINPDSSNSEGTDAAVVKLELDLMKILWNGVATSLSTNNIITIGPV
jgi:hypothetical protein